MATDRRRTLLRGATLLSLASLSFASPQNLPSWWPGTGFGSGSNGGNGHGNANGNGNGNGNNGAFPGTVSNFLGFDIQTAMHYRTIHGILASIAFVILFPVGSIFMRVIPGRFALWVHALTQVLALMLYIAAAGLGIYLVVMVRVPFQGGSLLANPDINYHPIIGLVVLAFVLIQPVLGYIHHAQFKKLKRRQVWSHLHLWNGRIMISLGIINGGLGLLVSRASGEIKTVYTVVAAIMWVGWLLAAVFGECKRAISARRESRQRRKELRPERAKQNSRSPSSESS